VVAEARALDGVARCRELLGDRVGAREALARAVALYRRMGLAELPAAQARLAALGGARAAADAGHGPLPR
jgi:hypothetical protein